MSSRISATVFFFSMLLLSAPFILAADPCLSGSGQRVPLPEADLAKIASDHKDDPWLALIAQAEFLGEKGKETSLDYSGFNPDYKPVQSARGQVRYLETSRCAHFVAGMKFREAEKMDAERRFRSYAYQKFRAGVVPAYYEGTAGDLAAAAEEWSAAQQLYFDLWISARKGYEAFWIFERSGELDKYVQRTEMILSEFEKIKKRENCKKLCGDRIQRHSYRLGKNLKEAKGS